MYRPSYSQNENQKLAAQFIQEFPLGLLISDTDGKIETSYLPFVVQVENDEVFLLSHLAKANSHWKSLQNRQALISFQGPNRYISPTFYKQKLNVPTWSYAVVQLFGTCEILSGATEIREVLNKSVEFFENRNGTRWRYDLPEDFQLKLEAAILALRFRVKEIEPKFKLNQNRDPVDYRAVSDFFKESPSEKDQEFFRWMNLTAQSLNHDMK